MTTLPSDSLNADLRTFKFTERGWTSKRTTRTRSSTSLAKSALKEETLHHAAGLSLRIEDDPSKRIKRLYSSLVNDHTYFKKPQNHSDRMEQLVLRAIADVVDKPKKTSDSVPDHVKGTQLYKYLITPIDNRLETGESFGHLVRSEPGFARPLMEMGMSRGPIKRLRISRVPRTVQDCITSSTTTTTVPVHQDLSFLEKNEADWTFADMAAYEMWWQALPSCKHDCEAPIQQSSSS